jgi:glycerol-3-phosphate dehydrogenase
MTTNTVNMHTRDEALRVLAASGKGAQPLDVLVIGGGVTGAGIALDAASRGLQTAVVEAQDWASGTSSRSSKLMHGGLRYLQMLDFKLVREALTERDLLLKKLAPHLVRPAPFLYPLRRAVWDRLYIGAGIALYDALASLEKGKRPLPWHRHLGRRGLKRVFPSLNPLEAVGAIQYWDATVDDARFVTTLLRTAVGNGAHAASRVQVVSLIKNSAGTVSGATLVDLETNHKFDVRARTVISATGVWTEHTQTMAAEGGLKVLASKGIHIVVPKERIQGDPGLILQTASSVLFVIPWSRYWVIGTTDTPWTEELTHPVPTARDIDYVLAEANKVLVPALTASDVVGTWAGLRPLLQREIKEGTASAKVSREHTVASPVPGLVSIAGGKLTTYRVMARDAVDFALGAEASRRPSRTAHIPLAGAGSQHAGRTEATALANRFQFTETMADHLVHRYGTEVAEIAAICDADRSSAVPLAGAPAYLRAEVIFALRAEGALHLDDLMHRRTRISYEYADLGAQALEEVASIARAELGWTEAQCCQEIDHYRAAAHAYLSALREPTDAAASGARLRAKELVPFVQV